MKMYGTRHKIGGKLFKIVGLIIILGVFFQKYVLFFILAPSLLTAGYLVVYSYFEYQKELSNPQK